MNKMVLPDPIDLETLVRTVAFQLMNNLFSPGWRRCRRCLWRDVRCPSLDTEHGGAIATTFCGYAYARTSKLEAMMS